ncbi:MAG TPA: molybdate ABC transporter substrate-binding protein [Burkholderiales bacterium]|nr:molybdate ABC transporter substrate-binding protein [Burkholderiales bacterium]
MRAFAAAAALLIAAAGTSAAEIKVYCPRTVRAAVDELAASFTRASGHRVLLEYGTAGTLQKRVARGAAGDVIIAPAAGIDALTKLGPVLEATRADLGRIGVGIAVRASATRPDLSGAEALKQTLLGARSLTYADPAFGSQSGIHAAGVIERLGIAAEVGAKTVLAPSAPDALARVASGDVELGIALVSEIRAAPGVVSAGAFPPPYRSALSYAAGVLRVSRAPDAARGFVAFLTGPQGRARFAQHGFETP